MIRNFHSFVIALVTCMAIFIYSCKSESQKFSEILESKDIELAYKFKAEHPNSSYNIDSVIQLLEYSKIRTSNDIQELNRFVDEFPDSYLRDTVSAQMAKIEWDNTIKSPNAENVSSFMKKYPKSLYYKLAENWVFENNHSGIFIDARDGNMYNWVKIGTQIWMAEDLKASQFISGVWIDYIEAEVRIPYLEKWQKASRNKQPARTELKYEDRGVMLYNWWTVNDSRGLAPEGWHVPSDKEWETLIDYLGGKENALVKMKAENGWGLSLNGNNASGFSAYPTHVRTNNGTYLVGEGGECYYWSSTASDIKSYNNYQPLDFNQVFVYYSHVYEIKCRTLSPDYGLAVRCVKN